MKPIVQKVLESGIVDEGAVKLMEQWGYLPDGAHKQIDSSKLKDATKETLEKIAEGLATEIEKEHHIRETHLDLERIRWPATVDIFRSPAEAAPDMALALDVSSVMDRMGRYYLRVDDVKKEWFVPGYVIRRRVTGQGVTFETILESQQLFINDLPVCWQITTKRES